MTPKKRPKNRKRRKQQKEQAQWANGCALCFQTRPKRLYTFVSWLVCPSIRPSVTLYLVFLRSLASLLLPNCSSDLKYGLCPPPRDQGSRVSVLNRHLHPLHITDVTTFRDTPSFRDKGCIKNDAFCSAMNRRRSTRQPEIHAVQ